MGRAFLQDTLVSAHSYITGLLPEEIGDPMGLVPSGGAQSAGAEAYDENALLINAATILIPGRQQRAIRSATKGIDSKLSRNGAFREAKEKAGVPRSQNPDKVYKERIRDQEGHVEGRVYEFKGQDGSTATIREHSLGHQQGNHGPHFNSELRNPNGIKQPLRGNGDSHTYFNR